MKVTDLRWYHVGQQKCKVVWVKIFYCKNLPIVTKTTLNRKRDSQAADSLIESMN